MTDIVSTAPGAAILTDTVYNAATDKVTIGKGNLVVNGVVYLGTDALAHIDALRSLSQSNLAAAIWAVTSGRIDGLTAQISTKMADIATRNESMAALNKEIQDTMLLKNGKPDNDAEQDAKIQGFQSQLDAFNSTQQLDMVKLQDLMSKNTDSTALLSAVLKQIADSLSGVVQKI